jgi:hypothetical protein
MRRVGTTDDFADAAEYLATEFLGYDRRRASCVRDFTSRLRHALRRWFSTVLGLMYS